jgi:hypothetical protein
LKKQSRDDSPNGQYPLKHFSGGSHIISRRMSIFFSKLLPLAIPGFFLGITKHLDPAILRHFGISPVIQKKTALIQQFAFFVHESSPVYTGCCRI